MTAMLHFLATNPHVKSIYPITASHFKLSSIEAIKEKIQDAVKLLHPYDNEANPFREPIDNGDIASTLSQITQDSAEN